MYKEIPVYDENRNVIGVAEVYERDGDVLVEIRWPENSKVGNYIKRENGYFSIELKELG